MKLSAQEEYGLRCMVAIGKLGPGAALTIPEIAAGEGISEPHAAKLMTILRKEGFVLSTRGQVGGYRLSRPIDQIKIGELLAALGGRLFEDDFCDRHSGVEEQCPHNGHCSLNDLWTRVQSAVDQVVYQITLRDVVSGSIGDALYARTGAHANGVPVHPIQLQPSDAEAVRSL
ncbi:MAG: Rrf2 family transcriptional regulator [Armatimonadetes bacterium]|nr:Rrf2 family transcriptional regulator [Armatimonadota bacterium]